jgi:hypothetical protein
MIDLDPFEKAAEAARALRRRDPVRRADLANLQDLLIGWRTKVVSRVPLG